MSRWPLASVARLVLCACAFSILPIDANASLVGYSINFTQTNSPHGDRGLHGEFFLESALLAATPAGRTLEFYPGYSNQVTGIGGGAVLFEGPNLLSGLKVTASLVVDSFPGVEYEFVDPGQPNYPLRPVAISFASDGSVTGIRTNLYKLGCPPGPLCHAIPATLILGTISIPGINPPAGSEKFTEEFPVGPGSAPSFADGYYSVSPLTAVPLPSASHLFAMGAFALAAFRRRSLMR